MYIRRGSVNWRPADMLHNPFSRVCFIPFTVLFFDEHSPARWLPDRGNMKTWHCNNKLRRQYRHESSKAFPSPIVQIIESLRLTHFERIIMIYWKNIMTAKRDVSIEINFTPLLKINDKNIEMSVIHRLALLYKKYINIWLNERWHEIMFNYYKQ